MKRHRLTSLAFITGISTFCLLFCIAQSQDTSALLRLAQQYEEQQNWDNAAKVYERLYTTDPSNFVFYNGLQRSYLQLKRYDDAIRVTTGWCNTHPNDIPQRNVLAGLYYDAGNERSADSLWNVLLTEAKENTAVHRFVAQEQLQHRLYEKAIETYSRARTVSKNTILFADEVGLLYLSLQEYEKAANEYIRMLKQRPDNLSFVQARLNSVASRPEALKAFAAALSSAVHSAPENVPLLRLLVWIQLQSNQPLAAFETTKQIDKLEKRNGSELLQFAQRLVQEQFLSAAATAYLEFINSFKTHPQLAQASMGYATVLYELAKQQDTLLNLFAETPFNNKQPTAVQASYADAVRWYQRALQSSPPPEIAAQCWFALGTLYYDHLNQCDSAKKALINVLQLQHSTELSFAATKKLGEVYICLGMVDEAQKCFLLLTTARNPSLQQEGWYSTARLEYYQAQFDSAIIHLKPLTTQLSSNAANDALQLQLFILENKTVAPNALTEFALAEFLTQQRKYAEALDAYNRIIAKYHTTPLIDDAYLNLGILSLKLSRISDALTAFRILSDSLPLSIWKEKALWYTGLVYEQLTRNTLSAIQTYEELLIRFPNSLYAEECRKRIRSLRGDAKNTVQ